MNPIYLGVNIDHIATLRQARGTRYPDPILAALLAEQAGADGITLHLREDRRHIQNRDLDALHETLKTRMNLEMAATDDMLTLAEHIRPQHCCIVPEKREELTTEGGLNVLAQMDYLKQVCLRLRQADIEVSLFIDPEPAQIDAAKTVGANAIEIHTGRYADAINPTRAKIQLETIILAVKHATHLDLTVNAGHGLHYHNVQAIACIPQIHELNIGHSIIARACFTGIAAAVKEMKSLMVRARTSS